MKSTSLVFKTIEWYGTKLHHRGNYRVVKALRRLTQADVDAELIVRRADLTWPLNPSDFVHQDVFWRATKDRWDDNIGYRSFVSDRG